VFLLFAMLGCLHQKAAQTVDHMRLSIEVTQEQHQRLKAISALRGQSIKNYVLERVFQPLPETNSFNRYGRCPAAIGSLFKAAY
jgi:Antitoxin ParD